MHPTAWRRSSAGRRAPLHPEGQALLWGLGDGRSVSRGGDCLGLSSLCPLSSSENTPGKATIDGAGNLELEIKAYI